MRGCVTHHAACDCREAAHARELAEAQAEVERLKAQLGDAHFQRDEAVHFIDEWRAVAEKREAEARAYRTSTQQAEEALGNARIELAEARAEVDRLRGVLDVSAKTLAIQTETAAALREERAKLRKALVFADSTLGAAMETVLIAAKEGPIVDTVWVGDGLTLYELLGHTKDATHAALMASPPLAGSMPMISGP